MHTRPVPLLSRHPCDIVPLAPGFRTQISPLLDLSCAGEVLAALLPIPLFKTAMQPCSFAHGSNPATEVKRQAYYLHAALARFETLSCHLTMTNSVFFGWVASILWQAIHLYWIYVLGRLYLG